MFSAKEREQLLHYLPTLNQSQVRRLLSGKDRYPEGFDRLKCIYVHIPKTAGTSLTNALFGHPTPGHLPLSWFQHIDPERFEQYYKFTFVRNPWDRLISGYSYMARKQSRGAATAEWIRFINKFDSFEDFVTRWVSEENIERQKTFVPQYRFVFDKFGMQTLDFVGRFENLQADYQYLCQQLGAGQSLPHANKADRSDYRAYYSAATRDIVARVYARDIELFEYTFD
jgi:hypothetical protein